MFSIGCVGWGDEKPPLDPRKMSETQQNALSLDGRFQILMDKPLPELNSPGGAAYAASMKSDLTQDMFAIICSREYLPRIEFVQSMRTVDTGSNFRLREGGVVPWPAQNASYFTLVYEKPMSERYWTSLDDVHSPVSEDVLNQLFIIPMVKALLEFQRIGFMHGGIRPTNIFWRAGGSTPPQFGEALSCPAGVGQPIAFETIERGMCQPLARGTGTHVDDCYAFGMTLAMIITGVNPFRGMDDDTIIRHKMEKGSFNAATGSKRLSSKQIELLRGLLTDDPHHRWDAADMEQWLGGRKITSKSSDAARKASRHIEVGGKTYWQAKTLAKGMADNVAESVKLIENGTLEKWLTRSLADTVKAKDIAEIIESTRDGGGKHAHYQDQLVAKVCIVLDNASPIRYRNLSVTPWGISTLLAHSLAARETLQILSEIISGKFVTLWVNMQRESKVDYVPMAQQMERMHSLLERGAYGEGLERVLYEINPYIPCLSPMLRSYCVLSTRHILPVLEQVAVTGSHPSEPMDRHMAAYIVARERRSEAIFVAMGPSETPLRRGLALLSLYGEMQYRYGPERLPRVAAWLMPLLEPCIARYLSKPFQDKIRRQAAEAATKGALSQLLRLIDDPARVTGDEQDFLEARLMYLKIQREIASIQQEMTDANKMAVEYGRPVAASIASLLAIIFITMTLARAALSALG